MRIWMLFVVLALVSGCGGQLYTVKLDANPDTSRTPGVVVYQPRLMKATYEFTRLQNERGEIIGTAGKECEPIKFDKPETHPDYATRYALVYEPGPFARHRFSISLSSGMVTSVNVESEPMVSQVIDALAGAVQKVVPIIAPVPLAAPLKALVEGKPACNAVPRLVDLTPMR